MIPRRLRRWILVWTPITWLTLEMITYPKDRPISSGLANVLGGFFDPIVADYPAWIMLLVGVLVLTKAVSGFVRDATKRRANGALIALGLLMLVWGLVAGGIGDFSLKGTQCEVGWLFQTIALILVAVSIWLWALDSKERAELFTWNTRALWKLYRSSRQGMVGLVILIVFVLMALFAPFLADHATLDPNAVVPGATAFNPPERSYYLWMGTDAMAQSVLSEFVWSSRISLTVGIMATLVSTILGAGVGIAAGYYSGRSGDVLMRITDAFLVMPWLPLAMVLASLGSKSYWLIIIIIGLTSWPGTARVVRSDALRIRELQFIERAKAIGASNTRIMTKNVLPNLFPLIFANTILVVAIAILSETTLSFLGLGDPLNFSYGTMLQYAWTSGAAGLPAWWYLLPPGIAIILVVLAFTFIGTAYDEVLDPKLRKREDSGTESRFTGRTTDTPVAAIAGGGGGMYTPGQQLDDAMPDFNRPAGGSINRPEGGGWVGGHIEDDEEGGEEE